ncbi:MAG: hypothetical protein MZW92_81000 [Comamonadaceae bacterium]|nr:hypothetical protein [Comamonadaceae bacterium]
MIGAGAAADRPRRSTATLGRFDGALLTGLLIAYTVFLVRQSRAEPAAGGPRRVREEFAAPAAAGRWDVAVAGAGRR